MASECPECGKEYDKLGAHWQYNSNHRPSFTEHQREIITGLLMGDGSLNRGSLNPHLEVTMISPNYLEYLDNVFGCLSTGVRFAMTGAENAEKHRSSGFTPNANDKDYSDVYRWQIRCHPELHDFNWYKTGNKVFPEDIKLTPTVLKHWYCGDGCWDNNGDANRAIICMANEIENKNKINQYFRDAGLPEPSSYSDSVARFSKYDTPKLFEYMGEPLPDFEYKWPERYR